MKDKNQNDIFMMPQNKQYIIRNVKFEDKLYFFLFFVCLLGFL